MDLRGTEFVVSLGMLWTSVGSHAVHRVDISAVIFWTFFTLAQAHTYCALLLVWCKSLFGTFCLILPSKVWYLLHHFCLFIHLSVCHTYGLCSSTL